MDILSVQRWSYIPEVPDDIAPIRKLLETYSQIPSKDIDSHLLHIRDAAWKTTRYPCIGRWKFLNLIDGLDPLYQQVLFRLKVTGSRDAFLDLGCGVGQVIRQLRADEVPGAQLFGVDVEQRLVTIGSDLFRDHDSLGATFIIGDMLDPDDQGLHEARGRVTIIHATSFFHLFSWIQQVYIGRRIVEFLKPGTQNALVFGKHMGTTAASEPAMQSTSPYLHDQASFQKMWDEVGQLTNTRWVVDMKGLEMPADDNLCAPKGAVPYKFTVYQLPH